MPCPLSVTKTLSGVRIVSTTAVLLTLCLAWTPSTLAADCFPIYPPGQVLEVQLSADGRHGTVGMDGCDMFVLAYEQPGAGPLPHNVSDVFQVQYWPDGSLLRPPSPVSAYQEVGEGGAVIHSDPSVASSANGGIRLAWVGECRHCSPAVGPILMHKDFGFSWIPIPETIPLDPLLQGLIHAAPSPGVGMEYPQARMTWTEQSSCSGGAPDPLGVVVGVSREDRYSIRECDCLEPPNHAYCRSEWLPSLSIDSMSGYFAIGFACDEQPTIAGSAFNIALHVYDYNGLLVAALDGPDPNSPALWVDNPVLEDPDPESDTNQVSPAVSFVGDDIVVCWVGPGLAECEGAAVDHIYARHFKFDFSLQQLRDPNPELGEGRAGIFVVDSNPDFSVHPASANPTVAITLREYLAPPPEGAGRFIVAWNATAVGAARVQWVAGQYFDAQARPVGRQFVVNQWAGTGTIAALGRSSAHTVVYGKSDEVVATWTEGAEEQGVWFTLLPPDYRETTGPSCSWCVEHPGSCLYCFRGDVSDDCGLNGLDIEPFVDLLVAQDLVCLNFAEICRGDMNADDAITTDDIPCFIEKLLTGTSACEGYGRSGGDCNNNGVFDANDIAYGTSQDCNDNFIPDECDVDPADPDGDGLVSNDLNTSGVPDECEPDCNNNGVPDDKDIADQTSSDVNGNGIPDECEPDCNNNNVPDAWDISQGTSEDCNASGIPDECESDCNANGVPDDCDIDPSDPDGNNQVSPDCNENGNPDECDLSMPPPLGSTDCNDNLVPDECDIASGYSQDANQNGIPDECEQGFGPGGGGDGPMGGGSEDTGGDAGATADGGATGSPLEGEALDAAWTAYFDWAFAQDWGPAAPLSGAEQFQAMMAKMQELGLPVGVPAE